MERCKSSSSRVLSPRTVTHPQAETHTQGRILLRPRSRFPSRHPGWGWLLSHRPHPETQTHSHPKWNKTQTYALSSPALGELKDKVQPSVEGKKRRSLSPQTVGPGAVERVGALSQQPGGPWKSRLW